MINNQLNINKMELKLFSDSEVFQKDRPTKPTDSQIENFYTRMAEECISEGFCDDSPEDIIPDLQRLYPFNNNGYEMAKELDWYGTDTSFCEWLDGLGYEYSKLTEDNVKQWVKAHNPQPKFEKGQKLQVNLPLNYKYKKDDIIFITGFTNDTACYLINPVPNHNGGTVITYEKLESNCSLI